MKDSELSHGNKIEGLGSKIIRHVRSGTIDPSTIARGTKRIFGEVVLSGVHKACMERVSFQPDYLNVNGLNFTEYFFTVFKIPETAVAAYFGNSLIPMGIRACIYEFPSHSRLELVVLDKDSNIKDGQLLQDTPAAFASIVGPTAICYPKHGRVPNNGFYTQGQGNLIPFQRELPSWFRKGAFGAKHKGELVLLDDRQIKEAVADDFSGFNYLVGTSFYLKESDLLTNIPPQPEKARLSYLFQYRSREGILKTCYGIAGNLITRSKFFEMVSDYLNFNAGTLHRAVELELSFANCMVKGPRETDVFGSSHFEQRRDHYLFFSG